MARQASDGAHETTTQTGLEGEEGWKADSLRANRWEIAASDPLLTHLAKQYSLCFGARLLVLLFSASVHTDRAQRDDVDGDHDDGSPGRRGANDGDGGGGGDGDSGNAFAGADGGDAGDADNSSPRRGGDAAGGVSAGGDSGDASPKQKKKDKSLRPAADHLRPLLGMESIKRTIALPWHSRGCLIAGLGLILLWTAAVATASLVHLNNTQYLTSELGVASLRSAEAARALYIAMRFASANETLHPILPAGLFICTTTSDDTLPVTEAATRPVTLETAVPLARGTAGLSPLAMLDTGSTCPARETTSDTPAASQHKSLWDRLCDRIAAAILRVGRHIRDLPASGRGDPQATTRDPPALSEAFSLAPGDDPNAAATIDASVFRQLRILSTARTNSAAAAAAALRRTAIAPVNAAPPTGLVPTDTPLVDTYASDFNELLRGAATTLARFDEALRFVCTTCDGV